MPVHGHWYTANFPPLRPAGDANSLIAQIVVKILSADFGHAYAPNPHTIAIVMRHHQDQPWLQSWRRAERVSLERVS